MRFAVQAQFFAMLAAVLPLAGAQQIGFVGMDRRSFAPNAKERVSARYRISGPSTVFISVWDADRQLVKVLASGLSKPAGEHTIAWDGRDSQGRLVPNEAYFFTIEAKTRSGLTEVYDPETITGGEFGDITKGQISRRSGTINYSLSQPSRVLVRAGLPGSSLLKTVVDWEPRPAGAITDYWNGKDEDGLIDVLSLKPTIIISYMTLPDTSVITYGNTQYTYREYKRKFRASAPRKPERPLANARRISPHFLKSRLTDRAFRVKISFPEANAGKDPLPTVKDRLLVRLELDPKDREVIEQQQYEIIFFVDHVFYAEEERGYLPFNHPIELKQLPPGEHVVTANIITFSDQVGVGSRKFRVSR